MDAREHLRGLSNHYEKLTPLLIYLRRLESICGCIVFGDELISKRTEIVIVCMIDKADIIFVESFHQGFLRALLVLIPALLRISLIEVIGPASSSVGPA